MPREDYDHQEQIPLRNAVVRASSMPPAPRGGFTEDVEVIDLDDPRRDIKPTTWHF